MAVIGEDFSAVLSAAQRGDEVAYSRLWRDANPPLLRYLRVVTSGDPDDIAAETGASIVRGLRLFRGDESGWRAWLFATARRRAIDDGRRRSRERDIPVDDISDLVPLEALVQPSGDPADLVLAQLALDEALQAIRGLPPLQAEVLVLRIVAGLSTETVAALTGSTPGAVRVAAHRGLKRLAGQFTPAGAVRM